MPRTSFLRGKVAVDDGTPITDSAIIQTNCSGRVRTEGHTDSRGTFAFEVGSQQSEISGIDQASDSAPSMTAMGGANRTSRDLRQCELQAILPGFTSQVIELASYTSDFSDADVGTIMLHRTSQVEGFTISVTSAAAPANARKEYEKGRELAKKEKWVAAMEKFQKAVDHYPKYAVAWFELGKVQLQTNNASGAQQSFRRAIVADPKFISPYQVLAQMALHEQKWQEVVDTTQQVLKLNPVDFPDYWLFNAAANYNLKHFEDAEKSAVRGLEVDTAHRVPKLEQVEAMILAQKHDYLGAAEHLRNYLRLSPNAADGSMAKKQLEEFEQLSPKANVDR
jgi:tetratricopeptide (TPR) repeat protein